MYGTYKKSKCACFGGRVLRVAMDKLTEKQWFNRQWAKGKNPIHLFWHVYLVRYESIYFSRWPFYKIKIFKEHPIDK